MNKKMKTVICGGASVFALTVLSSTVVFAAPSTGDDIENSVWSYRAVADVDTQVNIRAYASSDSEIIGYLPKGASADLIEKGAEWSHIISNGVEGYIKNDYLAYGSDAEYLASVYGAQGVKVNWDGVNLFASPDAAADVLNTADNGSEYTIISEEGDWYQVQMDDATTAYVPAEDVQETIITDRAISLQTQSDNSSYVSADDTTDYDNTYSESTTTDGTEATDWNASYTEDYSTEDSYTDSTQEDTSYTENTYSEDAYTNYGYTEEQTTGSTGNDTDYTQPETEAPTAEPEAGEVSDAPDSAQTEETVTTANADDLNLLAAIIYCEAGNQSREGKVAVGAVVLNRVASSSFPNNIHDIIYQSGQFTPASSGALASALANGVPSACVEAAQAALNGENPVGGALYFNTGSGRGTKIGAHQFY